MEIIDPKPASDRSEPSDGQVPGKKPDNFLVWAILSTIFCCLPFGIAAIVYATQVDTYWYNGNYEGAFHAARQARTWTWVSVGVAAALWVGYLVFVLFFAAALALPVLG